MNPAGTHRASLELPDRAGALGRFFERAGEAPRLMAYDEDVGCPLGHALSTIEWTLGVGILNETDLIHAARLGSESAAAVVERQRDGRRVYVFLGPKIDAPPVDPIEGSLLYDEPGVRAHEFAQRATALGHFLRATQGGGAMFSLLSRRAPQLLHVRRWIGAVFQEPPPELSNALLAGWFATTRAGLLFAPTSPSGSYRYEEVSREPIEL